MPDCQVCLVPWWWGKSGQVFDPAGGRISRELKQPTRETAPARRKAPEKERVQSASQPAVGGPAAWPTPKIIVMNPRAAGTSEVRV